MPRKNEVTTYQNLKEKVQEVNDKLRSLQENTSDYIAENPAKSTLLAFGIGVVAGAVLMKLLERK